MTLITRKTLQQEAIQERRETRLLREFLAENNRCSREQCQRSPEVQGDSALRGFQYGEKLMKQFHISDVLSVTTGRLVSTRHIDGIYDILGFLTGNTGLFTHQLPRAMDEVEPCLRSQYPQLFPDDPKMVVLLSKLDADVKGGDQKTICNSWVKAVQVTYGLPEMLNLNPMREGEHEFINPIQELVDKIGAEKVMVMEVEEVQ